MKDNFEVIVSVMLDGICEMGFVSVFGLNKVMILWFKRAEYVYRLGVDVTFLNFFEENLLSFVGEWFVLWIVGV